MYLTVEGDCCIEIVWVDMEGYDNERAGCLLLLTLLFKDLRCGHYQMITVRTGILRSRGFNM